MNVTTEPTWHPINNSADNLPHCSSASSSPGGHPGRLGTRAAWYSLRWLNIGTQIPWSNSSGRTSRVMRQRCLIRNILSASLERGAVVGCRGTIGDEDGDGSPSVSWTEVGAISLSTNISSRSPESWWMNAFVSASSSIKDLRETMNPARR